jgi:hypothetical protein
MSRNLTRLNVSLTLGTAAFSKGLKSAGRGLQGFSDRVGRITLGILSPLNMIGATLSVGAFALGVKRAMAQIDGLAKSADALGMTTQALAGLNHAAELAGVGADGLQRAMSRLNRSVGEAATGTGEARKRLQHLGLSVAELEAMRPEERFGKIADAISGMAHHTDRAAASAALLGDRQGKMLPLLMQGSKGLQAAAAEAEALGLALSRVDAAQVEAANDAITKIKAAVSGLFQTITVRLAPFIEYFANSMVDSAVAVGGVGTAVDRVIDHTINGVSHIIDAWQGMSLLWTWAKKGFYSLAESIMGAIKHIVQGANWWADKFSALWDVISTGFKGVISLINVGWNVLREGVTKAVAYVSISMADILSTASRGMRALNGMEAEANRLFAISSRIRVGATSAAITAERATKAAQDEIIALGSEAASAMDRLFGHTELRSIAFVDTLKASFGELKDEAQDSIFSQLGEQRLADRFKQTVDIIQQESRMRAERRAEEIAEQQMHGESVAGLVAEQVAQQQDILTAAWRQGEQDRAKLSAMHWSMQTKTALGQIEAITRGVAQNNKAMFRINQIAGAANAAVNTAEGVTKALAAYPPPLSFAMAGLQAAAGAAQIAAIKSQSFGGGASAPSVAGSGGGVPQQQGPNAGAGPGTGRAGMPGHAGRLVLDRSVALDPIKLADAVNQAGLDGYIFDGIELR